MKNTFTYGTTPIAVLDAVITERFSAKLVGEDAQLLRKIVNQGIDAHLEGVTGSIFYWSDHRLLCDIAPADLKVILRRLAESDDENAYRLRSGILTVLGIEEI